MSVVALGAALLVGTAAAVGATLVRRPTMRLSARVRPYSVASRVALGATPSRADTPGAREFRGALARLFGPPLLAAASSIGHLIESRSEEHIRLALDRAGLPATSVDEFRLRQVGAGALSGVLGSVAAFALVHRPIVVVVGAIAGFTLGAARARREVERAIERRAARLRLELYTVNQLLALHLRTGAGPIQAVQRLVDRGHGEVVAELRAVLASVRSGMGEPEAFRHAADLTPEPAAARTYALFAASAERGADLAAALLALSDDLRESRRDQMRKLAVKRRAAMLVPTIAILAPIMLLFIAAPLPSFVLGHR